MSVNLIIIIGLFILAVVSGMLGLGVAFAAVPCTVHQSTIYLADLPGRRNLPGLQFI